MFIKWRGEFIIIVRGEEAKIDMANQEINKCKAARQPLKEMVNQAAHLEMKRMQMEGQKEKAKELVRKDQRVWSWRWVRSGKNVVILLLEPNLPCYTWARSCWTESLEAIGFHQVLAGLWGMPAWSTAKGQWLDLDSSLSVLTCLTRDNNQAASCVHLTVWLQDQ